MPGAPPRCPPPCPSAEVEVGQAQEFVVETQGAGGQGKVEVKITGPSRRPLPCKVGPAPPGGPHPVTYTPPEEGPYKVEVTYDGHPVPGSPFPVEAQLPPDPSKVRPLHAQHACKSVSLPPPCTRVSSCTGHARPTDGLRACVLLHAHTARACSLHAHAAYVCCCTLAAAFVAHTECAQPGCARVAHILAHCSLHTAPCTLPPLARCLYLPRLHTCMEGARAAGATARLPPACPRLARTRHRHGAPPAPCTPVASAELAAAPTHRLAHARVAPSPPPTCGFPPPTSIGVRLRAGSAGRQGGRAGPLHH